MMEERAVLSRLVILGFVCASGVTLGAQLPPSTPQTPQQAPPAVPAVTVPVVESDDAELKPQVRVFESTLKTAIENAGARLAQRAGQVVKDVQLALSADPVVSGFVNPGVGPHFEVKIPTILETGLNLFTIFRDKQQMQSVKPVARPVTANEAKVTSTTRLPAEDPMTVSPVIGGNFDPDREYTAYVRDGLMDAMLDYSTALQIRTGERLTIVAKLLDQSGNPLYSERMMILYIKSEDLAAFRAGRLTRDEAKLKIVDTRF
jgi:hypothetical protein